MTSHALNIIFSELSFHAATSDSWLNIFILDCLHKVVAYRKSDAPFIVGHDLLELTFQFAALPETRSYCDVPELQAI